MTLNIRAALSSGISVAAMLLAFSSEAALAETRSCVDPANPTAVGTGSQTAAPDIITPGPMMPGPPITMIQMVPNPVFNPVTGMTTTTLIPVLVTVPGPPVPGPPVFTSANSTVCGSGAQALGTSSVAVGHNAAALQTSSVAIGHNSRVGGGADKSVAIGADSTALQPYSVALGSGSLADEPYTVSVGSPTQQRRITNVGTGTSPTDAVNLAQLNAALAAGSGNNFIKINPGLLPQANAAATGFNSIAIGDHSVAGTGAVPNNATAVGGNAHAEGASSTSFGANANAASTQSTAINCNRI